MHQNILYSLKTIRRAILLLTYFPKYELKRRIYFHVEQKILLSRFTIFKSLRLNIMISLIIINYIDKIHILNKCAV